MNRGSNNVIQSGDSVKRNCNGNAVRAAIFFFFFFTLAAADMILTILWRQLTFKIARHGCLRKFSRFSRSGAAVTRLELGARKKSSFLSARRLNLLRQHSQSTMRRYI